MSPGTVIGQAPAAGTQVRPGTSVDVFVAADVGLWPDVIGRSAADARQLLNRNRLDLGEADDGSRKPPSAQSQPVAPGGDARTAGALWTSSWPSRRRSRQRPRSTAAGVATHHAQARRACARAGYSVAVAPAPAPGRRHAAASRARARVAALRGGPVGAPVASVAEPTPASPRRIHWGMGHAHRWRRCWPISYRATVVGPRPGAPEVARAVVRARVRSALGSRTPAIGPAGPLSDGSGLRLISRLEIGTPRSRRITSLARRPRAGLRDERHATGSLTLGSIPALGATRLSERIGSGMDAGAEAREIKEALRTRRRLPLGTVLDGIGRACRTCWISGPGHPRRRLEPLARSEDRDREDLRVRRGD